MMRNIHYLIIQDKMFDLLTPTKQLNQILCQSLYSVFDCNFIHSFTVIVRVTLLLQLLILFVLVTQRKR